MRISLSFQLVVATIVAIPTIVSAQGGGAGGGAGGRGAGRGGGGRGGPPVVMDSARAQQLYVSNKREDFPPANYDAQRTAKLRTDSAYEAHSRGVMDFKKITYKSTDGLEIPAYLFQPLTKRGEKGHAAMVWVHDGVHGNFGTTNMFPFVREAVERGYVIICPEYRGSTGFGKEFYDAFDYGGKEVDDVAAAVDYLKTLPYVDQDRLGIMGWSHGGFIASHILFRKEHPFKAGAAIVPVTNLVFRLSYSGPGYSRDYAATIGGLPFEKKADYIERSPVYKVENLKVPMLVHVATNDTDVNFVEDQQMVYALRALKPDLAETKIYVDPPIGPAGGGHTFSRRVDPVTFERQDTPEQIDSWNRTWTFFEWWLRPAFDPSKATKQ